MSKFFEKFDQFGALFAMKVFNQDQEFRSPYGGIVSLLIYITMAVYSSYQLILWQTKEIPPTVVSKLMYVPEGMYLNMTTRLFTFSVENCFATDELHSLEEKGRMFTVEGTYFGMNNSIHPLNLNPENYGCGFKKDKIDLFNPLCLNPNEEEQRWFYQDATRLNDVYFDYRVHFCDPEKDPKCLSQQDTAPFLTEDNYWRLTAITQDVDLQTGEIFEIPTDYYFSINKERPIFIQIKVTKAVLFIDDGFLLPNIREIQIVKEIELLVTMNPPTVNAGPQIQISMERYQIEIEIQFVKLAGIIADISSMLQTLLLIGYFLTKVNNTMLLSRIKEALIQIYFPQSRSYTLLYDWRNRIKGVERSGLLLDRQQSTQYTNFRTRIFSAIDMQLNQLHMLSQINKIQLALQMIIPRSLIRQMREVDYSMKCDVSPLSMRDKDVLDEDDFMVFQKLSPTDDKIYPHDDEYPSEFPTEIQKKGMVKIQSKMHDNIPLAFHQLQNKNRKRSIVISRLSKSSLKNSQFSHRQSQTGQMHSKAYAPPENLDVVPSEEASDISIDELIDKISTRMIENLHQKAQVIDTSNLSNLQLEEVD